MIDLNKLKKEGKVVVPGFGVFHLLERRKGKVNSPLPRAKGKNAPRYKKRVRFVPSKPLKDKVCL